MKRSTPQPSDWNGQGRPTGFLRRLALAAVLVGGVSGLPSACGQTNYQQIKSFGFPALVSGWLQGPPLMMGSDGYLYGTSVSHVPPTTIGGSVFRLSRNGSYYRNLHQFPESTNDGALPMAIMESRDGTLYGTTSGGGVNRLGTIFKIQKDGTGYSRVWDFNGVDDGGGGSGLVEGSDGAFYLASGVIFKVNRDGTGAQVLHRYIYSPLDTSSAPGALAALGDGFLYGVTQVGGPPANIEAAEAQGTVFRMREDGSGYTILHTFYSGDPRHPDEGQFPVSLIQGTDGVLYGTTSNGGRDDLGTLFRLAPDGSDYSVLLGFGPHGTPGANPPGILEGPDGLLYGNIRPSPSEGLATVYRVRKDGTGYTNLQVVAATVMPARDGLLYGTTMQTIFASNADGSGYRPLRTIEWGGGDARNPNVNLIESRVDGKLYSATSAGGTEDTGALSGGAVYALNKDGSAYVVLRSFSQTGGGPANPTGLTEAHDGLLYGTSWSGGSSNVGTVFRLGRDGAGLALLHSFSGIDGSTPNDGVVEGRDGFFYGATTVGGRSNSGTVFRLSKDGREFAVLWDLMESTNYPGIRWTTVLEGTDAALYGTAADYNGSYIFKIQEDGSGFNVLAQFPGRGSGFGPHARLTEASDGWLYGAATDYAGGGGDTPGFLFKLQKDGEGYAVIYRFSPQQGAQGGGSLVEGPDGALYGATLGYSYPPDVAGSGGAVFKLNKDGSAYTVLHTFDAGAGRGIRPHAGLLLGSDGDFYGTASEGGELNFGTIFRLSNTSFSPRLTGLRLDTGGAVLDLAGAAGQATEIQATPSSGALEWVGVGSVALNSEGLGRFTDPGALRQSARLYRVRQ